ncbi:MAG TPA: hypothetical protein VFB12_33040 [Ktedonobacteraceae bacterium]|nr:hypothetical protein [Ktedonobacteraceae bacterium]
MQQVQQRELPSERMSWARAMIFAVGFFFVAAILIGQLPSYVYIQVTSATLTGFEQGTFTLGITCLAGFAIVQVIVLLFDPKPLVPPTILTGLGVILSVAGFALAIWAYLSGNQYFPTGGPNGTVWNPMLGGQVLWFEPDAVDFLSLGLTILGVGLAMVFYSILAIGEQRNPDRRDLGTTPAIRWMIIASIILLLLYLIGYTQVDDTGLAAAIFGPKDAFGVKIVDLVIGVFLGAAILLASAAFALRLHYLMRPVRKRTMSGLYAIGALGLAQIGAILLLFWIIIYPLIAWMHTWTFIGLGSFLTICARQAAIPQSCTFTQDAGYLVDAIVTTNFFVMMLAAVWAWKSNRNLVVVGGVVITAVIGAATLLMHTATNDILVSAFLCGAMIVLAALWTTVARRDFAIVGENNLGCLGQWFVVGTCLLIYLASFAFFSVAGYVIPAPETAPNIPFTPGQMIPPPTVPGQAPPLPQNDATVMFIILGLLTAIQFFFLVRNRYKV